MQGATAAVERVFREKYRRLITSLAADSVTSTSQRRRRRGPSVAAETGGDRRPQHNIRPGQHRRWMTFQPGPEATVGVDQLLIGDDTGSRAGTNRVHPQLCGQLTQPSRFLVTEHRRRTRGHRSDPITSTARFPPAPGTALPNSAPAGSALAHRRTYPERKPQPPQILSGGPAFGLATVRPPDRRVSSGTTDHTPGWRSCAGPGKAPDRSLRATSRSR